MLSLRREDSDCHGLLEASRKRKVCRTAEGWGESRRVVDYPGPGLNDNIAHMPLRSLEVWDFMHLRDSDHEKRTRPFSLRGGFLPSHGTIPHVHAVFAAFFAAHQELML